MAVAWRGPTARQSALSPAVLRWVWRRACISELGLVNPSGSKSLAEWLARGRANWAGLGHRDQPASGDSLSGCGERKQHVKMRRQGIAGEKQLAEEIAGDRRGDRPGQPGGRGIWRRLESAAN